MTTINYFTNVADMINHHQLKLVDFVVTMDHIRGYFNILENNPDMVIADAAKEMGITSTQLIALNGWIKQQCLENESIRQFGHSVQSFAANLVQEGISNIR